MTFDCIIDFIYEIEYGETLEKVITERQVDQIIDFLAFLTRNGIPDLADASKDKLEQDISLLKGEPNESERCFQMLCLGV